MTPFSRDPITFGKLRVPWQYVDAGRSTNRNTSGSLKEEKMLWEHKKSKEKDKLLQDCFCL